MNIVIKCTFALIITGFTFVVVICFQTAVTVRDGLELWRLNSVEGWVLVAAKDGMLPKTLVENVIGVKMDNKRVIVVDGDQKQSSIKRKGDDWVVEKSVLTKERQADEIYCKPGNLKLHHFVMQYWWCFVLEILAILAVLSTPVAGKRKCCTHANT